MFFIIIHQEDTCTKGFCVFRLTEEEMGTHQKGFLKKVM